MHPVSLTGEILPPQRDKRGHYLSGNSGNPGGMSEAKREMQALARSHSVEAIERAVEIMRTGKSETTRLMAISMILDRAWGKPKQEIAVEDQGQTLEQMLIAIWESKHAAKAQEQADGGQED
jgi:hypothetical protein